MAAATERLTALLQSAAPADAELLARFVRARDEAAFAAIVERHGQWVLGVCRRVAGEADADDVFQAVFLTLSRNAHRLRRPESLPAWLHATAHRLSLNAVRARRRRDSAENRAPAKSATSPLDELSARELLAILDSLIQKLPEQDRSALILICLDGLSLEEAAGRLGVTCGTVKGRLERGRARLRKLLEKQGLAGPAVIGAGLLVASPGAIAQPLMDTTVAVSLGKSLPSTAAKALLTTPSWRYLTAALLVAAITGSAGLLTLTKTDTPAQPPGNPPKKAETEQLPPGVVARLGVPRLPLRSPMAFAPDGRTFLGVSGDTVIRFDAATGKAISQTKFSETFSIPQLSTDGNRIAEIRLSFDQNNRRVTARVWDTSTKRLLFERSLPDMVISRMAMSGNKEWLAAVVFSTNGKPATRIEVWDLSDPKDRKLEPFATDGGDLVFSPTGNRLLVWNGMRGIRCWDVARDRIEWTSKGRCDQAIFSPDGRMVLRWDAIAKIWFAMDAAKGKPLEGLKFPTERAYSNPIVAPDNRTFVLPTKRGVILWDLKEGRERCLLPGTDRDTVADASYVGPFAPDGKSFLTNFGALQRHELATGRPLWPDTTELGQTTPPAALVYSADGKWLASGSYEDYTVRIWDVKVGRVFHTLRGHTSYVRALAFAPDGKTLVTGGGDSTLRVWDVASGRELRVIRLHDERDRTEHQQVVALELSAEGNKAAIFGLQRLGKAGNNDDAYSVWDLSSGKLLEKRKNAFGAESDLVHGLVMPQPALLRDNGVIVGKDGALARPAPKKQQNENLHDAHIAANQFVAAAAVYHRDNPAGFRGVLVWEVATGQPIARVPVKELEQISFARSGSNFVTINRSEIQNWDIRTGKVVRSQPVGRTAARLGTTSLAVSPDGKTAATGHNDTTILLWDIAPPELKPAPLTASERDKFWTDLAGSDAAKAFAAVCRFADVPNQSLPFLKEKLRAIYRPTVGEVKNLVADLQSPVFKTREAAEKTLRSFTDLDESPLRDALKADLSPEARKRIEAILASLSPAVAPQGEALRGVRVVWVLERIGMPEARKLLEMLAIGDSRLAREAKAALERSESQFNSKLIK